MNQPFTGQPGQQAPQYGQRAPYPQQPPQGGPHRYPGQHPQQGQPGGQILLNSSYFAMAWMLKSKQVTAFVDGTPVPIGWGNYPLPVPPGQHQIGVHIQYMGKTVGAAQTAVSVGQGQQVQLNYRAPAWMSSPGSIGAGPQPTNGIGLSLTVSFVPFIFAMIVLIITLST